METARRRTLLWIFVERENIPFAYTFIYIEPAKTELKVIITRQKSAFLESMVQYLPLRFGRQVPPNV